MLSGQQRQNMCHAFGKKTPGNLSYPDTERMSFSHKQWPVRLTKSKQAKNFPSHQQKLNQTMMPERENYWDPKLHMPMCTKVAKVKSLNAGSYFDIQSLKQPTRGQKYHILAMGQACCIMLCSVLNIELLFLTTNSVADFINALPKTFSWHRFWD